MLRSLIALLAAISITSLCLAQDSSYVAEPKKERTPFNWKDRLWYGGGIGLNFGSVTAVQLDPLVGVHLDQAHKFSVGLGPSYYYLKFNAPGYDPITGYGYRVFTRYRVIEQAFLHAEFYHLNIERYNVLDKLERTWVPHILVGGGYREPVGESSSFYLQILWEVLQDPNSVYRNQGPIISGGIGIGF